MSDDIFDGKILGDKLSKLNSSQQSIESLSRWCISHRKKAKQIVESWDKLFKVAQREQRVSFLYLANDILQNSRRKGSEFVNEFWKVLPGALKHVYENGDEHGKKAASRLVDIWEERKVFGSRGQNLKDGMLGKNPLPIPPLSSNGKSSNPIRIVKRDAHSIRIKLAVGGMAEKIITSFQTVHDQNVDEESNLNKFSGAIRRAREIESEVEGISAQGNLQGSALVDEIHEQENILQQCLNQLENAEATRAALVSHLKEALQDQDSMLELLRSQLQAARGQFEQVVNLRERLTSAPNIILNQQTDVTRAVEPKSPLTHLTTLPPLSQPLMTFPTSKTTEEENMKAAAAAVAAKLTASSSSAQMLTSVLSSLVAEQAASMGGGSKSSGFSSGLPMFPPEKRPKLEKPMSGSDGNNSEAVNLAYFTSLQQQSTGNMPLAPPTSMQPMSQANQMQAPFPPPAPPPPPPGPPSNSSTNQFVQSAGVMMGVMPYGYGASTLPPPPPPLPLHVAMGLARPALQPPQQAQSTQTQQQNSNGGYYRPPGIGFYGQSHQPTPPPVPRQ